MSYTANTIVLSDPSHPERPRHMAYYEWGQHDNSNVVLCVHGLSRNGRDFDVLAQALSTSYRVLCPSMAGRGKSDWLANKADYTYATYLADIQTMLQQLKLENVTWVGTSMGGILGMMLAATQPARVSRMVLNDVGSIVSAQGLKRILSYVGIFSEFSTKDAAMERLRVILKPFGITSEMQMEQMFAISYTALPNGAYAFAYDPAIAKPLMDAAKQGTAIEDVDLSMFWNAVQCPVLILRGEDSDILERSTAQTMCKRQQVTDYVEFAGTGHAPALMDSQQVSTVVNWIKNTFL